MKQCRYLEHVDGEPYCVYWDLALRGSEDVRCYPDGWECYEEPGGCIFEGRWMTLSDRDSYDYIEYLESKSERELPEGLEWSDFRLDRGGLAELLRPGRPHPSPSVTGEFHFLKLRPEYPRIVRSVALALMHYDTEVKRQHFDRAGSPQWVASLRLVDGSCQVDLAAILTETGLEFIEGYCYHGALCPTVEELKRAIVTDWDFGELRQDLVDELLRRTAEDLYAS